MIFRQVFDRVFSFESALAAAVFVAVAGAMAYGIVRYRAGARDEPASQDTEHKRVEALYAAGLLLVAIGIVVYTRGQNALDNRQNRRSPAVQIVVTGFQWCWRFHYVRPPLTVTGDCQNGRYPTLVLPTGEPVRIVTTADDVIHSFWLPQFRYKMDAFPHHRNAFTITVNRPGQWLGHCAEFCGTEHSTMLFNLRAVPRRQFDRWLRARAAATSSPVPAAAQARP